jgi:hypothetical protein
VSHAAYQSFESAADQDGLSGVAALVKGRIGNKLNQQILRPHHDYVATSKNPELTKAALDGGWEAVSSWMAKKYSTRRDFFHGPARFEAAQIHALLPLWASCRAANPKSIPCHKKIEFIHRDLNMLASVYGPREPFRQLLEIFAQGGSGIGAGTPASVLGLMQKAFFSLELDPLELPPPFGVLLVMLDSSGNNELRELAAYLRACDEPSPKALLLLWKDLIEVHEIEISNTKRMLADKDWRYLMHDPRFDVLAAKKALDELPRHRRSVLELTSAGIMLINLDWSLSVSEQRRASIAGGQPSGKGHDFVVRTFQMYGLPLTGIASGRYLRKAKS